MTDTELALKVEDVMLRASQHQIVCEGKHEANVRDGVYTLTCTIGCATLVLGERDRALFEHDRAIKTWVAQEMAAHALNVADAMMVALCHRLVLAEKIVAALATNGYMPITPGTWMPDHVALAATHLDARNYHRHVSGT